ncbi:MAG TPA: hypothetical protein VHY84_15130 [Bryobacteraceae bacterium]|nr:hypothetical protein [Bryobacteraceae bacterium]
MRFQQSGQRGRDASLIVEGHFFPGVRSWSLTLPNGLQCPDPCRLEATHERALEVVSLEMLVKSSRLN